MSKKEALERHKRLIAAGWTRRFTAEEPRLSEMKDLYESLGLEVLATSATPEEGQECADCLDIPGFEGRYKTIYTRGKAEPENDAAPDLFD